MTNVTPSDKQATQRPPGPGIVIKQERGRKTYQALIAAGFKLLEKREFEAITIIDISRVAGYSVGAFYARFKSKDEFFEAMIAHHIRERAVSREELLANAPRDKFVEQLIEQLVDSYWRRRQFWRAALMRCVRDPTFWAPIYNSALQFVGLVTDRIQADAGRQLTEAECDNIRFAIHMVFGMVNNRIVNRPKPSLIGNSTFVANLTRAFRLVSDYDRLMGGNP
jgi:AcrR family transcriptional regulator